MRTRAKSGFVLIFLSIFILSIGCSEKDNLIGPDTLKPDVKIVMKVGGQEVLDTVKIAQGSIVEFVAYNSGKATLSGWTWYFADDKTISTGQYASHIYKLAIGAKTQLSITAYDSLSQGHTTTIDIEIIESFDVVKSLWVESVEEFGNSFKITWGALKTSYLNFPGNWVYTGDPIGSWIVSMPVAIIDTNYNVVDGELSPATGTEFGKYIKLTMYLPADTLYNMGIGKLRDGNPDDMVWGSYLGQFTTATNPTLIKFRVLNNGTVVPITTPAPKPLVPGVVGDDYVRSSLSGNNLSIYVNTGDKGVKPFVKITNNDNTLLTKTTTPIPDFPGWSVYQVDLATLPGEKLVAMHYGNDISEPNVYNANEISSKYWNKTENILKFQVLALVLPKTSGQGFIKFSMIPA